MRWDTYHTESITEKYVYRYLTLEKLVDFLETGELYMTRLDKFEDNLENISPYSINVLKVRSGLTSKPQDANPNIPEHHWEQLIKTSREQLKAIRDKLLLTQKKRFVSCWILSDVESFAMWDIYGKAGFAIRFNRDHFQTLIRDSIGLQVFPMNKMDLLVAGKVSYQNFDDMIFREEESYLKFSVFRKHLSFRHESEYRVVGFIPEVLEYSGMRYKLPDLNDIEFDIIANPRLSAFQFNKYKSILSKYSQKHLLTESELKIWLEFRNTEYE